MSDIKKKTVLIDGAEKLAMDIAQYSRGLIVDDERILDVVQEHIIPFESFFDTYSCAIMEMETKFNVLNKQFSLIYDGNPIVYIVSRVKDYDSILRKVIRKNLPRTLEAIEQNIRDIAGVRVVCSFKEDIYRLERCLLSQDDVTLIDRKDYIEHPKPSGYRSLHLIVSIPIFLEQGKKDVIVEVQLRTIAMDFWANLEHKLKYKKNIDPHKLEDLSKELIDCANVSASLDERMQNVRDCLVKDQPRRAQTADEIINELLQGNGMQ